jgi:hypothetical protein
LLILLILSIVTKDFLPRGKRHGAGGIVPRYRIHGLTLQSEFPLRHAASAADGDPVAVQIRRGSHPNVGSAIRVGDWLSGDPQALRFCVPDVATYTCVAGREIWIMPEPDAPPGKVELFTLGTALGIIHYQRGDFPLHGAFVADENQAYGFCGASGEGKSTLALALARSGRAVLADDVAIVRFVDGQALVYAESTHLKVRQDALGAYTGESKGCVKFDEGIDKYFVPLQTKAPASPPRLSALVVLESGPPGTEPLIAPLQHVSALVALREHTYRSFLIPALGLERQHLEFSAALLKQVRVYRFQRPRSLERLHEGVELVMRQLADASG